MRKEATALALAAMFAGINGKAVWTVRLPSPKNAPISGGSVEIDDATGRATVRYGK